MERHNDTIIIAVDHGYGNMKTANHCFPSGILAHEGEPTFPDNLLYYEGRYYTIGAGHKEYRPDKALDLDYYLLMLAGIAMELNDAGLTGGDIFLAAGLPLKWAGTQKEAFRAYLLQKETATYIFNFKQYTVHFVGCEIYPQGFAAIAANAAELKGTTMLCDLGNGTMNLMLLRNGKPDITRMWTEEYGVKQCVGAIKDALMDAFHEKVPEELITDYLIHGSADASDEYLAVMEKAAKAYAAGVFRILREHEYNPKAMGLYIIGGGGCLIRSFADYDKRRVTFNDDISATAKGYEFMAKRTLENRRYVS